MRSIAAALIVSTAASVGLAVLYALGGQAQLEGVLLAVAFGGIGAALVGWAKAYLPHGPFIEERKTEPARPGPESEAEQAFERGADEIARRKVLARLLGPAVAGLAAALVFPVRSLGTRPGRSLFHTAWRPGSRCVTADGRRVRASEVPVDGVLTVFPERHTDAADSQTLLIRLPEGGFLGTRAPGGLVAYSKICTHAGCPVGLYQAETRELLCPCHQSLFAVMDEARPVAGPATRPLPRLPLAVDPEGYVVALGDFPEPVRPGFWNRGRS